MELPLAAQDQTLSPQAIIRAIRQVDLMLASSATEPKELDGGILFINPKLPGVHMANGAMQLHAPEGKTPAAVLQEVMSCFQSAGQTCYWLQTAEPIWSESWIAAAQALGYQPGPSVAVLRLQQWRPSSPRGPASASHLQILPGRALRRQLYETYRQVACQEHAASDHLARQLADWHLAHLDEPRCQSLVARRDGRIVGYLNVVSLGNIGVIDHLLTLREFRGQGIASALLEEALNLCARAQYQSVVLEALIGSHAIGLYQRRGFVIIGEHRRYEKPMES